MSNFFDDTMQGLLEAVDMDKKYEIFDVEAEMYKANENFPSTMVFRLSWVANLGFGELNFYYDTEKQEWECDSECMSKKFCQAVLDKWLENIMSN